jgi:D-3-phosphoglycerate dehydrogenase
MTRPLAVYTDVVELDPAPGVALLEEAGLEVRVLGSADPAVIREGARDAEALLIAYSPVDADLVAALPRLKVVATQSVGTDMVDLAACRQRGIAVPNVPGAATEEVATHALAMTLALVRALPWLDRDVRDGIWDGTRHHPLRLSELTVGVLGLGRIGRRYVDLVRPMVREVIAHDPHAALPDGVTGGSVADVLERSDVVSLHLPLTAESRHLLDAAAIARMRAGALLVNVSRGALVDPVALRAALDSGHLAGAALDVLPDEPPASGDPLVQHPRTLVTPHAAYLSEASGRDYVLTQARNVIEHLRRHP